jgi:hypothetical protein
MFIPPTQVTTPGQPLLTTSTLLAVLEGELPAAGQLFQATVRAVSGTQAIVDVLGGGSLRITAAPGTQQGATLTLRAGGNPARPQVELVKSIVETPLPQTVEASTLPVKAGEPVAVRVLAQVAPDRVVAEVRGQLIEARVEQPLSTGETYRAEVQQVRPEVVLRLIERPVPGASSPVAARTPELLLRVSDGPPLSVEQMATMLRQRWQTAPVGEVVQQVLAEIGPTSNPLVQAVASRLRALLPPGEAPSAERLSEFVRDGGLQYEAKLGKLAISDGPDREKAATQLVKEDVKGLILQALSDPAIRESEGAARAALGRQLQSIEAQQSANLLALARGDPVVLQAPLFLPGGSVSTLHLSVEKDDTQVSASGENTGYNLLMHLDLEQLGTVRIDAQIGSIGTKVIFYVEKSEGRQVLQAELASLREAMRDTNVGPVLLAVRGLEQLPIERRAPFQALVSGLPQSGSSLDLRA